LRVITASGSGLILMRMADALRELDAHAGLQVHRSWWVAREAVRAIRRDSGKTILELSNGQQVPVSRTYLAAVRSAAFEAVA
jgi:DNA-binding LytR/AlgR family response regulator